MMTVHEVSALTGVSIRALHHYDKIGLLHPAGVSPAGYRLYDEDDLARLQCILLYRELQFPLKDIRDIMESPAFERGRALEQQIALLELKKAHLENLIDLAKAIKICGVKYLNFTAFDAKKLDEYAREAKANWGTSPEYREYEEKAKGRTQAEQQRLSMELMGILAAFGGMRDRDPADAEVQAQVAKLQGFISEHLYTCSNSILLSLGRMYAGASSMSENIDAAGGPGAAEFAARAIEVYCANR